MTLKYLITGATGGLGRYVLDYFVANKPLHEFAAASSRESNRTQFEDCGIAFRQVDYDDPATLDKAFRDVENLLFVSTNTFDNEKRRKQHQNFVDAAKAFPVLLNWYPDSTTVPLPADGPMALTLRSELGEATARLMIAGGHENEIVLLTAEDTIRPSEIVDIINQTTGREVKFERVSPEGYIRIYGENDRGGKPKAFFQQTLTWYEGIEKGELATTHSLMRELLGREPTKPRDAIQGLLLENPNYTWHQNYVN
ncbi:unnamed protein product [Aspergillus oryzae]|uniref:Unnamed protein product n=1 Tax=Aspergillus oryzae var. brunneus TaxID=332754 RepID=A0ABQ6KRT4_ASPOZ|nr:unnamed protein product [Aspergillus oryzae]GMF95086.1 unnamed protein product [Aspergillus oryzae]GMG13478.1 unnamed protein product [Aspergillus oryzae]GMG46056.1 unnamed protein product [Aspergillus oryzae var. brunneus]